MEFTTRLIFEANTVFNINIGGFKKYHPTRRVQLKENYKAEGISINSYGILGPEFKLQPNPKGIRLLIIGDSATFSPPQKNYSKVLKEKLSAYFPGDSIEVIAGAVPGYSTYESLDWYNEFLYKLQPDITIIYLGWNDLGQFHPFGLRYKNERLKYQDRSWIGILTENLYLLRVPYFFIGRIEKSKAVDILPLTSEEKEILDKFSPTYYATNLKTLIQKLKEQGSIVYLSTLAGLITYPQTDEELARMHFARGMNRKLEIYRAVYEKYEEALEEVSINTETQLIDLRTLIRNPRQRNIFTDTMHINVKGAEVYGNYIAETIKTKVEEVLMQKARDN